MSVGCILTGVISGFRREGAENCALLGYYAASSGYFLPTCLGQPVGPILNIEEFLNPPILEPTGWDRLVVPKFR